MLACLRIADLVTEAVARLTTGSGGLAPGRAGFAPAGQQTKFHGVIAALQFQLTSRAWSHAIATLGKQARIAALADHSSNTVVVSTSSTEGRHHTRVGRPNNLGTPQRSSMIQGRRHCNASTSECPETQQRAAHNLLPHVPSNRNHRLPRQRGHHRERSGHCGAREPVLHRDLRPHKLVVTLLPILEQRFPTSRRLSPRLRYVRNGRACRLKSPF